MELLHELYAMHSPSGKTDAMMSLIERKCAAIEGVSIKKEKGNLYATKGEGATYPCIVCHTDEVHTKRSKGFGIWTIGDIWFGFDTRGKKQAGIGADDKNGIWVALKMLESEKVCKAAFFRDEEIGCAGSREADMDFFADCRFVLQCDRKGAHDFIVNASWTQLCDEDFPKRCGIEEFGYKPADGMMTDVMELKEAGLAVCAANISCGYYNPHTDNETTDIKELENCLALVRHIFATITEVQPHIATRESLWNWVPSRYAKSYAKDDYQAPQEQLDAWNWAYENAGEEAAMCRADGLTRDDAIELLLDDFAEKLTRAEIESIVDMEYWEEQEEK